MYTCHVLRDAFPIPWIFLRICAYSCCCVDENTWIDLIFYGRVHISITCELAFVVLSCHACVLVWDRCMMCGLYRSGGGLCDADGVRPGKRYSPRGRKLIAVVSLKLLCLSVTNNCKPPLRRNMWTCDAHDTDFISSVPSHNDHVSSEEISQ